MELRIAADELKKALHRALGIVERKAAMPVLSTVLISASKSNVTVTAFDLDIGIVSAHPAEVLKSGAITVAAKTLFDIVNFLPEATLTMKRLPNNYAELTCGATHYKIVGMAPEEFPKLPQAAAIQPAKISGVVLLEMIKKTQFAMSTDETRYILNGVFLEAQEANKVRMVATDGHRLAMVERTVPFNMKLKEGVIIPRKGLLELRRLLDEAPEAECELGFAENSAIFQKPGLSMVMRLIDGQFPEYQRVIPQETGKQLNVRRTKLYNALKRIALVSAEKAHAVKVSLSENLLRITANNPDLGEAKDDLEITYDGGTLVVGFNARYLLDVLGVLDTEEVSLEFGDEHSPGVLHAPGDRSFLAVVMPMRV